ncbi:MAG TPA: DUF5674 family protein [Pyrinomonadaceae bacterium]|nr:DUF5674 family protein [Pyrinomonadaceae bacterium]
MKRVFCWERGSSQDNLWGINLHPKKDLPDMVEFDPVINIRPRQDNPSRYVEDGIVRERVIAVVRDLVK